MTPNNDDALVEAIAEAIAETPTGLTDGNVYSVLLQTFWAETDEGEDHVTPARALLQQVARAALTAHRNYKGE